MCGYSFFRLMGQESDSTCRSRLAQDALTEDPQHDLPQLHVADVHPSPRVFPQMYEGPLVGKTHFFE